MIKPIIKDQQLLAKKQPPQLKLICPLQPILAIRLMLTKLNVLEWLPI